MPHRPSRFPRLMLATVSVVATTTLVILAGSPATVRAAGTPALIKEASTEVVSPGDAFSYRLVPSCSGLQEGCVNAVLTDTFPPEVEVDQAALPTSTSEYNIAYDAGTRTLTVTFLIPLASPPNPPGSVGLPAGSSFNLDIGVNLPPESQVLDGSTITNTATLTADERPPVPATADVEVDVPRVVRPVATKNWADGGAVAGTEETGTITLGIRNASSSTAAVDSLTLEDATPAVFERFDVTSVGPVTFPPGADRVVVAACTELLSACDEADYTASPAQTGPALALPAGVTAGAVTGLRFIFTNSAGTPIPYSATEGTVQVGTVLRDTLRSGGAYNPTTSETIDNCVQPSGADPVLGAVAGDDACDTTVVFPAQATISTAKTFFSDTNHNYAPDGRAVDQQDSPVSALTRVTNTSPFALATLTITEPDPGATAEYSKIDVTSIRVEIPTGATGGILTVECGANGGTITTPLTALPATQNIAPGCSGTASPQSVTVTFSGAIGEGTVGGLGVTGTLNDTATGSDVDDGVQNCASSQASSAINGVGAASGNACAVLDLFPAFSSVDGVKSPQLATILPGFPRRFDLSLTNSGTIGAPDVVLADPADPTEPNNPFDQVRLASLTLPAAPPTAVAEVWDPNVAGYVAYDAGDAALLERARGFRVRLTEPLPAGATYALTFNVLLRDGVATGTPITNCAGVSSGAQTIRSFCATPMNVIEPSSGAALQKVLDPPSSVRPQAGLPGTPFQLKLAMQNTGTQFLRQLVGEDTDAAFFEAVDLTGAVRVNFPPGADRVRVDACSGACGPTDWTTGTTTGSQTPTLPIPAAEVRGVRVTFTAVPVVTPTDPADEYRITPGTNFPTSGPCTGASVCIGVVPRVDLRSAPGIPIPETLSDTATGGFESRAQPPGTLAPIPPTAATHTLTSGTAALRFSKTPNSSAAPGVGVPFFLTATNTGTGPMPGLTIIEPLPDQLDFSPLDPADPFEIAYTLPAGAPAPTTVEFTPTVDPGTGRVTALRWDFPGWDFLPGAVVTVNFRTELAPGVTAGQVVENRAGASSARPDMTCNTTGVPSPGQVVDDAQYGAGRYCTSGASVSVQAGNAFRAEKWVAGDPALGFLNTLTDEVVPLDEPACPQLDVDGVVFTRYPCVARVEPGQGFDFYLRLINTGTNPATEVRLVDAFPHDGDTGVLLTGDARGTEWQEAPTLLSAVTIAGAGDLAVDYTAAAAPVCTTDLNRPPTACAPADWPIDSYDPAATAFRATVAFPSLLAPGASTALRFRMAAPPDPTDASQNDVAWNSFAHTEFFQTAQGPVQLPPTEPIKTGVALVFGSLAISKTLVESTTADAFTIEYSCAVTPETPTGPGTPVIVDAGSVSLTGGAQAVVTDVPAGASCAVWEPDAHGLISNAPDRASALTAVVAGAQAAPAAVTNSAPPPPTTPPPTTTPPTDPPTTTPPADPPTTVDPSPPTPPTPPVTGPTTVPTPELPATGGNADRTAGYAVGALLLGAALALVARRRWRTTLR